MRFVVRQSVDMTPKQLAILLEEDKRQLGNRLFHHSPNIFGQIFERIIDIQTPKKKRRL